MIESAKAGMNTSTSDDDADAGACPSTDALMMYAEGDLDGAAQDRLDEHIDGCPACAAVVAYAAAQLREPSLDHGMGSGASATPGEPASSWTNIGLPSRVGRYVVLEQIGAGGMGIVCSGYDPRLQRTVAVKLLRPSLHDPEAASRLLREARALACLSHPNVVAVFECGALDDREGTYLVMEMVEGETLRRWCTREPRSPEEIVAAYLQAARGLSAAHAAGLVHRDFKPDNVLMGSDGRVRVTDFGLARTTALTTMTGDRDPTASDFAGTPSYMAPEQASGDAVGPAADQYALCVSLWEALVGQRPPHDDASRMSPRIRAVLQRGLEPDPQARWPSLEALTEALVRRRRWPALAVAGVAIATITTAAVVWWPAAPNEGAVQAAPPTCTDASATMDRMWTHQRREALVALAAASETPEVIEQLDGWVTRWRSRTDEACISEPERLRPDGCLTLAAQELDALIGVLLQAKTLDATLCAAVRDLPSPDACRGPDDAPPVMVGDPEAVAAIRAQLATASALTDAHRFDEARALGQAAVDRTRTLDETLLTQALQQHARIMRAAGDYPGEARAAEEAFLLAESLGLAVIAADVATQRVFSCSRTEQDFAAAAVWARHADAAIDRMDPSRRGLARARLRAARGHISQGEGRSEEAAASYVAALEELERFEEARPPEIAGLYNDYGSAIMQRDPEAALASFQQALAIVRAHYGERHRLVAMLLSNIAGVYYQRGEHVLAEASFRQSLEVMRSILGDDHPELAGAYLNLGLVQDELHDEMAARMSVSKALALMTTALGPDHPEVGNVRVNLGAIELEHENFDAAETELRAALAIFEATVGPEHSYCSNALRGLAEVEKARGHPERVLELASRSLAIDEKDGLGPVARASDALTIADAQLALGQRKAAIAGVRRIMAEIEADHAPEGDPAERTEVIEQLTQWLASHPS